MSTRRERVILEMVDEFTGPTIKAAAAAELLNRNLGNLSGQAVETNKTTREISKTNDEVAKSSKRASKEIDQFSGRVRILADIAAILAPTIAPIGAVMVPAVTGLGAAFGFAAIGAGTALAAFQGVGDALKAVNKAQLEPTTANLNAARAALEGLSPAAADFVGQIQTMMPQLKALRDTAAEGLFPGVTAGLDALEGAFPRVQHIFEAISTELGAIAKETGESLSSDRWAPFLDFVATEGPSALGQLADAVGNTAHAFAGLWMSTTPLNRDFLDWLVTATANLDEWSNKLGQTNGFKDFVSYIEKTGPQVGETFGAIANAAVQILQAISPLGGPALRGLEAVADAISTIADSGLGTPIFAAIAGMAILNRSMAAYDALQKATFGGAGVQRLLGSEKAMAALGSTTSRTSLALGSLKTVSVGAIAAILGIQAAHDAFEKKDPAKPIADYSEALAGLALGAAGAKKALDDAFKSDNSDWSRLTAGKSSIDSVNDAFTALGQNDLSMLAGFAHSGFGLWDSEADLAAKSVERADAALGQMVSGGNMQAAQESFEYLSDRARAAGLSTDEITKLFPQYTAAAQTASGTTGEWSSALNSATTQADNFTQALTRAQEVLTAQGAQIAYEASLDAVTESLKKNGQTLDVTTEKGRANATEIKNSADAALNYAQTMSDPRLQADFLKNARTQYIRARVAAGESRTAARKLADEIFNLNGVKGTPKVGLNTNEFNSNIARVNAELAKLTGRSYQIALVYTTQNAPGPGAAGILPDPNPPKKKKADGGYISGPGGPRDDLIPALLSNGEFVMPADAVSHYGVASMEMMRAKRFASGGKVGKLTSAEFNSASGSLTGSLASSLGLAATGPAADIRSAFHDFAVQIRQDGGKVGKGFTDLRDDLIKSAKAVEKNRDAIEKERSRRDRLNARLDSLTDRSNGLSDTIAGGLRHDIFTTDRSSSPWLSNAERAKSLSNNPLDALRGNIRDARAFTAAERKLKAKGLDGGAFEALASTGDLAQVQAFAGKSKKELAEYERLYNLSQKATRQAGDFGADVRFGAAIASAKAASAASTAEIKGLRGDLNRRIDNLADRVDNLAPAIGKTINKAAAPPKRGTR